MERVFERVEIIMGKVENVCQKNFFYYSKCFEMPTSTGLSKHGTL